MAEAPYLMGIDFGTGGVRVGLFDRQGTPAVFSAVELQTRHPRPGWAEQDPDEWWSALARATRGALEESGVPISHRSPPFIRAVRTFARHLARVGPMLPTGMSRSWLIDW